MFPLRYKSFQRLADVPKLYWLLAPGIILPATFNPVNVPTLVIFGCALVVNVPVKRLAETILALETFPIKLPIK